MKEQCNRKGEYVSCTSRTSTHLLPLGSSDPLSLQFSLQVAANLVTERTEILMTYALCGFGNVASMGIQVKNNQEILVPDWLITSHMT